MYIFTLFFYVKASDLKHCQQLIWKQKMSVYLGEFWMRLLMLSCQPDVSVFRFATMRWLMLSWLTLMCFCWSSPWKRWMRPFCRSFSCSLPYPQKPITNTMVAQCFNFSHFSRFFSGKSLSLISAMQYRPHTINTPWICHTSSPASVDG